MSAFLYYISLPFLYGLSLLPFWLLFRVSDIIYVLIYHVIGYRKKIVVTNLKNSFPEKSDDEIRQITRKFYRYFCDLILETLKTLTIKEETLRKHFLFEDKSIFQKYYQEKQSVIIVLGHFGNWELGGARFGLEALHTLYVIYHPLKNKYFESLIYYMRTRLGNKLYPMTTAVRDMLSDRDKITATAFIADQTPSSKNAHWMEFLNQDTPIFTGTEKIAKKLLYPVIYISIRRPKRGLYTLTPELLFAHPEQTSENEITEAHTRRLEEDIRQQPEIWLWTHRRWKHKRMINDELKNL